MIVKASCCCLQPKQCYETSRFKIGTDVEDIVASSTFIFRRSPAIRSAGLDYQIINEYDDSEEEYSGSEDGEYIRLGVVDPIEGRIVTALNSILQKLEGTFFLPDESDKSLSGDFKYLTFYLVNPEKRYALIPTSFLTHN